MYLSKSEGLCLFPKAMTMLKKMKFANLETHHLIPRFKRLCKLVRMFIE